MTAISSLRKFSECEAIAKNQRRAHASWTRVFTSIVYFGPVESELESEQTKFVPAEDFPKIKTLVTAAAISYPNACLINADIVVGEHLPAVIQQVIAKRGRAAVSRRYEFTGDDVERARLEDNDWGMDFFWATSDLWLQLTKVLPPHFRIGHDRWDAYLLGFFNTVAPGAFWDITGRRCIFHPRHVDRKREYEIWKVDDQFTLKSGMPRARL